MASVTQKSRRTAGDGESRSRRFAREQQDAASEQDEGMEEPAGDAGEDKQESGGESEGGSPTITSELRDTIREAAIEVLKPVAKQATTSAAKYAVTKGPDLVKDKVMPKLEGAGGVGGLASSAMSKTGGVTGAVGGIAEKLTGGGGDGKGGKKPTGHGRGRRLPVQEYVDVAVDLKTAYDQFTQFEDFPNFMHRVEKVEQKDDTTLMWHENIWGVRRSWEAEIVEQKPCERIVWRSKGQTQTVGVVTFHRLSDNLTRVYVNLDFQPKGLFEKTASGLRLSRRALKSDLMRFKAFVEMKDESTGAWRGVVEDSEVVDYQDDESEGGEDQEQPEGREDEEEQPEGREDEDEEPEAREDEDEEPEGREDEDEAPEGREDEDEEPKSREDEDYVDEDDEYEDEEDDERGSAEASSEDEGEEEPEEEDEEPVKPKRRASGTGTRKRSPASSSGRSRR